MSDSVQPGTVLVTGANGFVGRHLLIDLLRYGFAPNAAVRTSEGRRQLSALALLPPPTVTVVGSIDEGTDWRQALGAARAVVHLAGRVHAAQRDSRAAPAAGYDADCRAAASLARQAVERGVSHFVYVSSIAAVTSESETVVDERATCRPSTPYGRAKLAAERLVMEACRGSATAWTVLRPPVIYGPGDPGHLPRLARLVQSGWPLPLGNLRNRRSVLYVRNFTAAVIRVLQRPEALNELFVLSDGAPLSTSRMVQYMAAAMGRKARLVPVPTALARALLAALPRSAQDSGRLTGALSRLLGSIEVDGDHFRSRLDWSPPFTTQDGFAQTYGSFR